jgi:hypothetical protein
VIRGQEIVAALVVVIVALEVAIRKTAWHFYSSYFLNSNGLFTADFFHVKIIF